MNENPTPTSPNHSGASIPDGSIRVVLNGTGQSIPERCSIASLLRRSGVDPEQSGIAVALNDRLVRRSEWTDRTLSQGDRLEVITALQGG